MSDAGRDGTCPVCGAAADVASADRRSVERMAKALGQDAGPAAGAGPSRLARCTACELEFAVPLRAPGPLFYQWLVRAGFTYPAERWEWQACAALLAARAARSAGGCVVMDVGSGDGTFLRRLRAIPNLRAMGLEHQPEVAAKCLDDGLAVAVGDISRLAEVCPEGVDVVTFWHVIEHVDDPVALLAAARDRLREGGELCFSVPLTPMSYEHSWPDPFNEPPHHLTRWNLRALGALTARLGMQAEYLLPRAAPLPLRVLRSLVLQSAPPARGRWRKALSLARLLARDPSRLPREIGRQRQHPRHEGRVLPDLVLVRLRR